MPKKLRELKALLQQAGFIHRSGKGSHTVWEYPNSAIIVVLSGKDGADANLIRSERSRTLFVRQRSKPNEPLQYVDSMVR
jgi:predicted RNA binding protein YcfA (HicA-like mRNA interferase family)